MTSQQLKNDRAAFVTSANNCIEKLREGLNSAESIGTSLADTEDTALKVSVVEKNDEIKNVISEAISALESKMSAALAKIDVAIQNLERQEYEAAQKAKEDEEEEDTDSE